MQTATATIEFCDVDGGRDSAYMETGCTLTWDSAHNINHDPLFVGTRRMATTIFLRIRLASTPAIRPMSRNPARPIWTARRD